MTEQFVHAKAEVRTVDPVVLQVGQQREDVHRKAVAAVGQTAVDLALGKFGGLEAVQIDLFQPPEAIQAGLGRRDVRPRRRAASASSRVNSARISSSRAATRC